jgi:mannose-6-phosphate isomerase-like protein (cupin superfamily)
LYARFYILVRGHALPALPSSTQLEHCVLRADFIQSNSRCRAFARSINNR